VSADGGHFVVAEGSTTYAAYSTTLAQALAGKFGDGAPLFRETARGYVQMSPDGRTMLVGHPTRGGVAYQSARIGAGAAVPLPGVGPLLRARMIDSATVEMIARSGAGVVASLLDLATGASRERFTLPDTEAVSTNFLPRHGWAWLRGGRRPAVVLSSGRSTPVAAGTERGSAPVAWSFDAGRNRVATQSVGGEVTSFSFRVTDLDTGAGEIWFSGRGTWANAAWLADGSLLITVGDDFPNANVDVYALRGPKGVRYLGRIPGPVDSFDVAADGKVALVGTSAYRGDAWLSTIQRDD
jgi:hypothetical protein